MTERPHRSYPNSTITGTGVCPDLVDPAVYGHHVSWVDSGARIWEFERADGRNMFQQRVQRGDFRRSGISDPYDSKEPTDA